MDQFDVILSNVIDSTLGLRSRSFGYQYKRNLFKTVFWRINVKDFGLSVTSYIKTFALKYISVADK